MSRAEVINWCPPLHHAPQGATSPSPSTTLQTPFVAAIIGASRGMGAHMAYAFARAGASGLVITGRDQVALQAVAAEAARLSSREDINIRPIICDVLRDEDVEKLAGEIERDLGRLDCLILNAGTPASLLDDGSWPKGIHDHPLRDFRHVVDTNLMGGVAALHYLLPLVVASKGGPQTVVVVSSSAANNVDPGAIPVAYSLSKMACARLGELVHEGYAGEGVVAVSIQPGSVMTEGARAKLPEGKGWEKQLIDDVGLPGGFCVWLCREKRSWLSGRYVDCRWDVDELERRREEIVERDLLKFRLRL